MAGSERKPYKSEFGYLFKAGRKNGDKSARNLDRIPREIGKPSIVGEYEITRLDKHQFRLIHRKTSRQFLMWGRATSHVWEADEVVFRKGVATRVSTSCITYTSAHALMTGPLLTFIRRTEADKMAAAEKKRREELEIVRQRKEKERNNTHIWVQKTIKPEQQATYRVVFEDEVKLIYQGPGGEKDRYLIALLAGTEGGYRDGWVVKKMGTPWTDLIGYGFRTQQEAIDELSYHLYAPDTELVWLVEPDFACDIVERKDGSFFIETYLLNGAIWSSEIFFGTMLEALQLTAKQISAVPSGSDGRKGILKVANTFLHTALNKQREQYFLMMAQKEAPDSDVVVLPIEDYVPREKRNEEDT